MPNAIVILVSVEAISRLAMANKEIQSPIQIPRSASVFRTSTFSSVIELSGKLHDLRFSELETLPTHFQICNSWSQY